MNQTVLAQVIQLRQALHRCPEPSGREKLTREKLINFLERHTSMEIMPCGDGFYAAHREEAAAKPGIALRADYDALALPGGGAAHLCGHDGHSAALCGVALLLEGARLGREVFLLFQPAEETGEGAKKCLSLWESESIGEVYGMHNLPGFPLGRVTTRPGTFACASEGITLRFVGKATHAAYPEYGRSPADTVGNLLCELPLLSAQDRYTGMTLCTVIGIQMGQKAFGEAASEAEIWLTLRAEYGRELVTLKQNLLDFARVLAPKNGLEFSWEEQDVFPSTENDPRCVEKIMRLCQADRLPIPMRWSEDFGHYLSRCPGAFMGIGAGENHAALHTEDYEYPDALLAPSMEAFWKLIAN